LRRECLDQMLISGEGHLRRVLSAYAVYYNQARTHLALRKDAPSHRSVQRSGAIVGIPILAGLHKDVVGENRQVKAYWPNAKMPMVALAKHVDAITQWERVDGPRPFDH
jgi:hypothetical protein